MTQHDAETVRVGRENIARIRARLGVAGEQAGVDVPVTSALTALTVTRSTVEEVSADRMQLEMAIAEERDQMRETIERLEARVAQLEATLAAVVRTAAIGIASDAGIDGSDTVG